MELKLYDTLSREKRAFVPIDPERVRMYVCGPTVYDFAHIGNARPVIVFDVLYRLLRELYGAGHVAYVRNITDVDDKINARAAERGISIRDLTEDTYRNFRDDVAALGCLPPTVEPRATEHIGEMRQLIERLIASGHAYVAEEHVLFSVGAMPDYGQLSKRPLDEMIAGARVDVAPYKRDAMDFVLWKPSKPGEPSWPSPGGIETPGRPGWHIECSAMSWKHLGETFDLHGGGIDLVFPHHENEIAQSRCAFHTGVMANYWMHNGFLQVEGEKMSKSLGNFFTIRELLADWPGEVLRFNMLRTHYRQPIDWTVKGLEESWKTLDDWYALAVEDGQEHVAGAVLEALSDDLNTPRMLAELHGLKTRAQAGDRLARGEFVSSLRFLGFLRESASDWAARRHVSSDIDAAQVEALIATRTAARKAKNFAESDRIRDELAAMGVVLKDSKDGTTWEIAR
ncbi:cysteine--tRNA ligase [Xanthobacteraceae bacterium Astr-EGSB]|uniref:cysteine--tRNA ligase n=1 Tax=Astrobacterium formosum TaxID=3069710 RepID=UPI0027B05DBC|nr:cysteine--tRNA ligase [Xanthobacteraceae bacterium Astr-EGSB]